MKDGDSERVKLAYSCQFTLSTTKVIKQYKRKNKLNQDPPPQEQQNHKKAIVTEVCGRKE
jgi:hypothetical protein